MENYKGYHYKIQQDECNDDNPRDWDNLGIMICKHKRSDLGDISENKNIPWDELHSWGDVQNWIDLNYKVVGHIYALYLYDHSGLRIKIGSFNGLLPQGHAEFDSGQVGFIFTTQERLKIMGTPVDLIDKCLKDEVTTYDQYISGEVYGFDIFDKNDPEGEGDSLDCCGGFFGYQTAEDEAKAQIDSIVEDADSKAFQHVLEQEHIE